MHYDDSRDADAYDDGRRAYFRAVQSAGATHESVTSLRPTGQSAAFRDGWHSAAMQQRSAVEASVDDRVPACYEPETARRMTLARRPWFDR